MSDQHKAALAAGRVEGRAVRTYLEALRTNKPKRGRKRTPDSVKKRIAEIDAELPFADAVRQLRLTQDRIDLQDELEALESVVDISAAEAAFVNVAKAYGTRNKITYAAWREVGVPAAVLKAAGISRAAR
jgi:hypothetical protein